MWKFTLSIILGAVMVFALGVGVMAQTGTQGSDPPAVTKIEGEITAVDSANMTVAIVSGNTTAILNVTDTTEIEVPGNDAAVITDLAAGQHAEAKYETATRNALKIEVEGVKAGRIDGEITALDAAASKVTITPRKGDAVVLTASANTTIEVWDKDPATFADLKVGDQAQAKYDPATSVAIEIRIKNKGEKPDAVRQGFFGAVTASSNTSLTISAKQGEVTFVIDENTQVWDPPSKDATIADVEVGDRVAVLAVKDAETLTAGRVLIIPAKPVHIQVNGTITKIEGNTVTLTDKDGKTYTLELPQGQVNKLKVGDVLTVALKTGGDKAVARDVMKADEVKDRLKKFADNVKDRKAETEEAKSKRANDLEKLEALLKENMDRQQEIMEKVIEKAPAQAREALEKAKDTARQGWEQAKEALEKERGKGDTTSQEQKGRK